MAGAVLGPQPSQAAGTLWFDGCEPKQDTLSTPCWLLRACSMRAHVQAAEAGRLLVLPAFQALDAGVPSANYTASESLRCGLNRADSVPHNRIIVIGASPLWIIV